MKEQEEVLPSLGTSKRQAEYRCMGEVEGQAVEILLDTGCCRTSVHRYLVPQGKIDADNQVQLRCAHGDLVEYPTAEIEVVIKRVTYRIRAGVSSTLPEPV